MKGRELRSAVVHPKWNQKWSSSNRTIWYEVYKPKAILCHIWISLVPDISYRSLRRVAHVSKTILEHISATFPLVDWNDLTYRGPHSDSRCRYYVHRRFLSWILQHHWSWIYAATLIKVIGWATPSQESKLQTWDRPAIRLLPALPSDYRIHIPSGTPKHNTVATYTHVQYTLNHSSFLHMSSPDRQSNLYRQPLFHPCRKSGTYQVHQANQQYIPHTPQIGQGHWFHAFPHLRILTARQPRVWPAQGWNRLSWSYLANDGKRSKSAQDQQFRYHDAIE